MGKSIEQIARAIQLSGGNISEAARQLELTRRAVDKRVRKSVELGKILQDERESTVDLAEAELVKALKRGDMTAIIWTLKASPAAKKRGWGESQELKYSGEFNLLVVDK